MKIINNKKGFTLVELIVVITIIAILGTIAFISFKGYSAASRDSKRISDIKNIRTSLELFGLKTGKFPDPNNGIAVNIGPTELRTQGTFGEQNLRNISSINELPLDPLTQTEYTYSVTYNKKEFELGTILETDPLSLNTINRVNALIKRKATAYIRGNYNGRMIKIVIGSNLFVFAIPSIINTDYTLTEVLDLINAKKLAYNGFGNLPASYTGTVFELDGEDDLNLVNLAEFVVYNGTLDDLIDKEDSTSRIELLKSLKEAYIGTDLETEDGIVEFVNLDFTDTSNPTPIEENIAGSIINNDFGGDVEVIPASDSSSGGGEGGGDEGPLAGINVCGEGSIKYDNLDYYGETWISDDPDCSAVSSCGDVYFTPQFVENYEGDLCDTGGGCDCFWTTIEYGGKTWRSYTESSCYVGLENDGITEYAYVYYNRFTRGDSNTWIRLADAVNYSSTSCAEAADTVRIRENNGEYLATDDSGVPF